MKPYKVLICSYHMNMAIDRYRDQLAKNHIEYDTINRNPVVQEHELLEVIEQYDGVICSDDEFTRKVLEKAKRLKVISKWGVGINSIDLDATKELGIMVCNSPSALSESVAVYAWGMIINLTRHINQIDTLVRNGKWEKITGVCLVDKVIGIIGIGNIGKEIIKRACGFDMRIFGNDIQPIDKSFCKRYGVNIVSKEELFSKSDVVTLSVDLNPTSYHLIGVQELSLMKPTSYLINISRGPVIDEPALINALERQQIAGAGLDVFEKEPLPSDCKLFNFENCLLSSHNAYNSMEACDFIHENTIKNLISGLKTLV